MLSKKLLFSVPSIRRIHTSTPNRKPWLFSENVLKDYQELCSEHHAIHFELVAKIGCIAVIPLSILLWYHEYEENTVHKSRPKYPPYPFLHETSQQKLMPFGDGKHSILHNPYKNFVFGGYETDKQGNPTKELQKE